jgi:hypothetical protein
VSQQPTGYRALNRHRFTGLANMATAIMIWLVGGDGFEPPALSV